MSDAIKPEEFELTGSPDPLPRTETAGDAEKTPKAAYFVCVYHATIFVVSLGLTTFVIGPERLVKCPVGAAPTAVTAQSGCHFENHLLLAFAFLFGMLGSALSASRIVVLALRYKNYQSQKIAWQVLTPIHGGVLAVVGIYVVLGGLLAMVRSPTLGPEFGYFVGGFAFIVGFSSELFVKRLIRATEALFGEQEEKSVDAVSKDPPETKGST